MGTKMKVDRNEGSVREETLQREEVNDERRGRCWVVGGEK